SSRRGPGSTSRPPTSGTCATTRSRSSTAISVPPCSRTWTYCRTSPPQSRRPRPNDKADESGGKSMAATSPPAARAGSYRVGDLDLNRIGYGAMQLAGPGVFGPPRDRAAAIEVLRTAVELGVNHIDTADAYGPYITNEIIREALFPYGDHVHIVTKVGVVRDERAAGCPATRLSRCARRCTTTS